jgi:hypothetical protein
MTLEQMAKRSYVAYADHVGWKDYTGAPMPDWEDATDQVRIAWQVATRTAVAQVMTELQHAIYQADRERR